MIYSILFRFIAFMCYKYLSNIYGFIDLVFCFQDKFATAALFNP